MVLAAEGQEEAPAQLKVNIKRFHGVARWSWNVGGAAARANEFGGAGGGDYEEEDDIYAPKQFHCPSIIKKTQATILLPLHVARKIDLDRLVGT
jgi:hypothetical protein